jgi:hypothetical protein
VAVGSTPRRLRCTREGDCEQQIEALVKDARGVERDPQYVALPRGCPYLQAPKGLGEAGSLTDREDVEPEHLAGALERCALGCGRAAVG